MNYQELDHKYYVPTYKRFPITLVRGENARVWDDTGKEYVDALAGIAVNCLGHNNPALVNAISEQAKRMLHISNYFLSESQALLSKKLVEITKMDKVFFGNSGAEAVEGAIKFARKYAHNSKGKGGEIISFTGCFHGRTLATVVTGKDSQKKGFEPLPQGYKKAEFNNIESVRNLVDNNTAAIIIEPVQGEGGINIADKIFLKELRELCNKEEIVLIFDEVQCGVGRTGYWYAKDYFEIEPDILTSAKALGGGMPIGAVICKEKISSSINPGDHGTTFGGNPLACSAALATINEIEKNNLIEEAQKKGNWFKKKFEEKNNGNFGIKEIRGLGLMIGIELEFMTKPVVEKMLELGVIANATADKVIRIVPPLTIPYDDLEKVIEIMFDSISKVKENV
ncbi:MAG TPA: aspartate aminotransferase family protein [Ignavibacteriaceae bacterium]|nr:aspartate aminotransferase family protein [Ignavibacteriaceae bacterium]